MKATRSYLSSTPRERAYGFVAASMFSVVYYAAPLWVFGALMSPLIGYRASILVPVLTSLAIPSWVGPMIGKRILKTWLFEQMPKYFEFEEFHELPDSEAGARIRAGEKLIFVCHPHGVFPFVATCALVAALGAPSDTGVSDYAFKDHIISDMPTAVASVLRWVPLLKDIIGLFGIIDASGPVLRRRLKKGSFALYVGGMGELFLCSPNREAVILQRRKGFIKLALREGADVVPIYMFGNTTCLSALTWGPLAFLSRKFGVSLTVFWGRWGLPLPRPVKLVYARGRPLGLPHIPEPSDDDVNKWHAEYCRKLLLLFDTYKHHNPDYANKSLVIES